MYKSEISHALNRLQLVSGGTVHGLMQMIRSIEAKINAAIFEIAGNSDTAIKAGTSRLHQAIHPLSQRLAEISPFATVVELHQLGARFDSVLSDYPTLEPLLRPGRQAASALAGAFDVTLQKSRQPPALLGLIAPALELAACYDQYKALEALFSPSQDEETLSNIVTIQIDGASRLKSFANYVNLLSFLAGVATRFVGDSQRELAHPHREIVIESIESGSPIQIKFSGDGKTLRLLLTMLRDLVRLPYLYFTKHGRTLQAMETFALARELGITTPAVVSKLEDAMIDAAGRYANSLRNDEIVVSVQGEVIRQNSVLALPLSVDETSPSRLSLPSDGES